ncbi:hypothetical protein J31TS4_09250 [Paenibacillus sp. J31TS4]|uniref:hypothetical protein n=1 Tax=Paenibacillus sp. J31TS4 TaxID=2807195 RepID=UPI001B281C99|nr:hypothetical protein [Paenibacillus sp. J31TS4]GIP37645.1 hypothetical protein J31TS4_09250 [Paenibacillus sp. J31TS4]
MDPIRRRRHIAALRDELPRVSFYRMVRSPEFEELCRLYEQGIGIRSADQFAERAQRLERLFQP